MLPLVYKETHSTAPLTLEQKVSTIQRSTYVCAAETNQFCLRKKEITKHSNTEKQEKQENIQDSNFKKTCNVLPIKNLKTDPGKKQSNISGTKEAKVTKQIVN